MMILDTNVVSELMRPRPAEAVARWVGHQPAVSLYTTVITEAEILYGVLLLPKGKRRNAIAAAAEAMFETDFAGRVLAFGAEAARAYARIGADRRRAGDSRSRRSSAQIDGDRQLGRCYTLATRNVADFERCGIDVLDPWKHGR